MSGIEIAGLILGAFPLLIAALEKHKEAAVALGDWWKIRQIYQECIRLINCERTLFDQNLRGLLGPVLYDHSTLDELVTDPFGEQWRSESLAASLEDLLPTSHEIYIGIIKDFHRYMMAIGLELGLENQHFQRRMNVISHLQSLRFMDVDNSLRRQTIRVSARDEVTFATHSDLNGSESDSLSTGIVDKL